MQRSKKTIGIDEYGHLQAALTINEIAADCIIREQWKIFSCMAAHPRFEFRDPFFRREFGKSRDGTKLKQNISH